MLALLPNLTGMQQISCQASNSASCVFPEAHIVAVVPSVQLLLCMHNHTPFQQHNPNMRGQTGTSSKRLGCTLSSLSTHPSHCTISHHPWLTCRCAAAVADDAGQQHVLTLDAAGWAALWQQQEGLGLTCLLFDRVAPLEPGTQAMLTHLVRAGVGGGLRASNRLRRRCRYRCRYGCRYKGYICR